MMRFSPSWVCVNKGVVLNANDPFDIGLREAFGPPQGLFRALGRLKAEAQIVRVIRHCAGSKLACAKPLDSSRDGVQKEIG